MFEGEGDNPNMLIFYHCLLNASQLRTVEPHYFTNALKVPSSLGLVVMTVLGDVMEPPYTERAAYRSPSIIESNSSSVTPEATIRCSRSNTAKYGM